MENIFSYIIPGFDLDDVKGLKLAGLNASREVIKWN